MTKLSRICFRLFFLTIGEVAMRETKRALEETRATILSKHRNVVYEVKRRWEKIVGYDCNDAEDLPINRVYESCLSLGLLDFMNGMSGTIECTKPTIPRWWHKFSDLFIACKERGSMWVCTVNWTKGSMSYMQQNRDGIMEEKTIKIGKALAFVQRMVAKAVKEYNVDRENPHVSMTKIVTIINLSAPCLLVAHSVPLHSDAFCVIDEWKKEFETRKGFSYTWQITTDPGDIARMSHKRGWTSCMAPGGCAAQGVLSDMEAGSACIFFYNQTNPDPIGRVILRPGTIDDEPVVSMSGTLYGTGQALEPMYLASEIKRQRDVDISVAKTRLSDMKAIKNKIFDDNGVGHLSQSRQERQRSIEELELVFGSLILKGLKYTPDSSKKLMDLHSQYSKIMVPVVKQLFDIYDNWHRNLDLLAKARYLHNRLERKARYL